MATIAEQRAIAQMLDNSLIDALEIEKRDRPDHYVSALSLGERLRKDYIAFGQLDKLEPLPALEGSDKESLNIKD
ncbi:hypothetical protein FACS1894120_0600 [Clostridia bacterium]|nr:hypothetical protein FACS1894120_0600 [Clostridia bacterium]